MLDVLGESVLTFSNFLNFDDLFLSKLAQLTYNKTINVSLEWKLTLKEHAKKYDFTYRI